MKIHFFLISRQLELANSNFQVFKQSPFNLKLHCQLSKMKGERTGSIVEGVWINLILLFEILD